MSLTGAGTLAAAIVLLATVLVATLGFWGRLDRLGPSRWLIRAGMLISCQLLAIGVAALTLNRGYDFFLSWSELLGQHAQSHDRSPDTGSMDAALAPTLQAGFVSHRGTVVKMSIPGPSSGVKHEPAYVYLPSQYGSPAYASSSFPVVEMIPGFPGSPRSWTQYLHITTILDDTMRLNNVVPFIAVMPYSNVRYPRDAECVNVAGGPEADRYLTADVRSAIEGAFRADRNGSDWAIMGYSTGGYCAANLAMRHPDMFGAAVSLAGYNRAAHDRTTGSLFRGSQALADANDIVWRAEHLPAPKLNMLLVATRQDKSSLQQNKQFEAVARPPLRVWDLTLVRGGHNGAVWQSELPTALSWLSRFLPAPLTPIPSVDGLLPVPIQEHAVHNHVLHSRRLS